MAIIRAKRNELVTLKIAESGNSDVIIFEKGTGPVTGIMLTSDGTFSATSVAWKGTLDAGLQAALSDTGWKTLKADISAGVQEFVEPWAAFHFVTTSYVSGALVVRAMLY